MTAQGQLDAFVARVQSGDLPLTPGQRRLEIDQLIRTLEDTEEPTTLRSEDAQMLLDADIPFPAMKMLLRRVGRIE